MVRLFIAMAVLLFFLSCSNSTHSISGDDDTAQKDSEVTVDDDVDGEVEKIYDIKITQNENNSLSCFVTFKTADTVTPRVQYFMEDGRGYEIEAETAGTEHSFFLWGMKAQTKYSIEIYLDGDEAAYVTEFTSGILSDTVPEYEMTIKNTEKVSEGFLLLTTSATKEEEVFPTAVMIDTDGDIVWYYEHDIPGFASLGDMQYIEETQTVLTAIVKGENMAEIPAEEAVEIDLSGKIVWKSREYPNVYYWDDESWHHIYNRLPDDSIIMLRRDLTDTTIGDKIVNIDRNYNILWEWRYQDHYKPPQCNPATWCDWTHCNWVVMRKKENIAYLNVRHLSRFHKIDMETGEVIWTMGPDGDFTVISDLQDPWFEWAHAPKVYGENDEKVLLYDNGTVDRGYSRVIEYTIDEVNMVATVNYVFDGKETGQEWFTEAFGDADPLPGGNIMVTAGTDDLERPNKFFEVTRDGEIVWELTFTDGENWNSILYNSYKFIPPLKKIEK